MIKQAARPSAVRKPAPRARDNKTIEVVERWVGTYGTLGYRAARVATNEGRSYVSRSASAHNERDRESLIEQSRDFMRNNAIYSGMVEQMVTRTVGNGFKLQVKARSKGQADKIEKLWADWFRRPEIRGISSGAEVARMIMRELVVCGDVAALKLNKSLIQLFEAEQIAGGGKQYKQGIARDDMGRPSSFALAKYNTRGVIDKRSPTKINAKDVVYLTQPLRPSQIRGVPACQAAFPMLHRINDVCDSEAISWQMLSRLAIAINRKDAAIQAYEESREDPVKDDSELDGDLATRLSELDYALIYHAEPGEEVKGIERNIPGVNFSESLRMFLRLLGLPLGLPLELILLDWTRSNYSQSRAVLEQAYENFRQWQEKIRDFFFQPLFEWRLAAWRSNTAIGKAGKVEATWITPTWPWIDQVKETEAQAEKVERGFTTHAAVCKALNSDRDDVVAGREAEIRDAIERAKKIEADTGVAVPWRILAGLEDPGRPEKVAADPGDEKEDTGQDEDRNNE
jgi:lambda family phage portal protein